MNDNRYLNTSYQTRSCQHTLTENRRTKKERTRKKNTTRKKQSERFKDNLSIKEDVTIPKQTQNLEKVFALIFSELGKNRRSAVNGEIVPIDFMTFVYAGVFFDMKAVRNNLPNYCRQIAGLTIDIGGFMGISPKGKDELIAPIFSSIGINYDTESIEVTLNNFKQIREAYKDKLPRLKNGTTHRIINWNRVFNEYAPCPSEFFEVSRLANLIMNEIVFLSRQRTQKQEIADTGSIEIKISTLIDNLSLETDTRNLKQKTVDPLLKAFKEINMISGRDFTIDYEYNLRKLNTRGIIDEGRIIVSFSDEYKDKLSKVRPRKPRNKAKKQPTARRTVMPLE